MDWGRGVKYDTEILRHQGDRDRESRDYATLHPVPGSLPRVTSVIQKEISPATGALINECTWGEGGGGSGTGLLFSYKASQSFFLFYFLFFILLIDRFFTKEYCKQALKLYTLSTQAHEFVYSQ